MPFTGIIVVLLFHATFARPSYMSGQHVRAGMLLSDAPAGFLELLPNGELKVLTASRFTEQLEWMGRRLNFTYVAVAFNATSRVENFPKEFAVKNLSIGLLNAAITSERLKIVGYLTPTDYYNSVLVIPTPKKDANIWSVVSPFTQTVWLLVLLTMVVSIFLLRVFAVVKHRLQSDSTADPFTAWSTAAIYVFGVATNQGGTCSSKARSTRLMAGLWCLTAVVIVNGYTGSLIKYMTAPVLSPIVNSLEDLVKAENVPVGLLSNSNFLRRLFTTSQDRPYKDVAKKVVNNAELNNCTSFNNRLCRKLIKEQGYVMPMEHDSAKMMLIDDYSEERKCGLSLAEEYFLSIYAASVVPYSTPREQRNELDVAIQEAISYGLIQYWNTFDMTDKPGFHCRHFRRNNNGNKPVPLKLLDFSSAFLVLAIGTVLSFLAFLDELRTGKRQRRMSKNRRGRPASKTFAYFW